MTTPAPTSDRAGGPRGALVVLGLWTALCLARVAGDPFDTDAWWHLRTGRWMVDHRTLPRHDVFSWVAHGEPWRLNAWLTDALLGVVGRVLPIRTTMSVALLLGLAGLAALAYRLARRAGAPPWPAVVAAMAVEFLLTPFAFERPQVLSYLLFAAVALLLPRALGGSDRAFAGVIAVTLVWANLHLAFTAGLVLTATVSLGWVLRERRVARPALLVAGSALAGLLTPYGFGAFAAALSVRGASRIIVEWQRASLGELRDVLILLVAAAAWWSLLRTRRYRDPAVTLPLLAFTVLFVDAVRNGPFLLLVAGPEVALGIASVRTPQLRRVLAPRAGAIRDGTCLGIAVLLVATLVGIDHLRPVDPAVYPVHAVAALRDGPRRGCRLLNEYDQGGFLLARLGPSVLVSEDGRNDLYGEARILEQQHVLRGRPGALRWIVEHRVGCVLVRPDRRLRRLLEHRGWRVVTHDPSAVLLVPR